MTVLEMPAVVAFFPVRRHPVIARALADPMPVYPHVATAIPAPIAGRPRISATRRGYDDYSLRRWPDVDIHECTPAGGRAGHAGAERAQCGHNQNRGTDFHGIHLQRFRTNA